MTIFTTSDGVALHHVDRGEGRLVVLIAGHTAPLTSWDLLTDELLATGCRVVAVDRRHTGASDFPDHGLTLARQGQDLHEFMTWLESEDPAAFRANGVGPCVVASSLGVSATWAMIDQFGTDLVGSLVLVDQTPRMLAADDWEHGLYDLTGETLDEFLAVFPNAPDEGPFRRPMRAMPAPEAMPIVMALVNTPYDHDLARPLLRDHALADWRSLLPAIDVPALVIGGRHSELWPVEHAVAIADAIPDAKLMILEDSGHTPMLTEPAAFNMAVTAFATGP